MPTFKDETPGQLGKRSFDPRRRTSSSSDSLLLSDSSSDSSPLGASTPAQLRRSSAGSYLDSWLPPDSRACTPDSRASRNLFLHDSGYLEHSSSLALDFSSDCETYEVTKSGPGKMSLSLVICCIMIGAIGFGTVLPLSHLQSQELNGKYRSMEFAVLKINEREKKSYMHPALELEDFCINVNKDESKFKTGSYDLELDYPDNPNFRIPMSATEEAVYPDDPNFRTPTYLPKATEETDYPDDPNFRTPTYLSEATEETDYPDDPNFRIPSYLSETTEETDYPDDPKFRSPTLPKATEDDYPDNSDVHATVPKATEEANIPDEGVSVDGRI